MNDMMLMALTDPAGAPAHPLIFLVLGVVTFALHLTAVNVMLGTLGLAAWGCLLEEPVLAAPRGRPRHDRQGCRRGRHRARRCAAPLRAGDLRPVLVHLERDLGLVAPRLPRHPHGRLPRALPFLRPQPPL
ncbi:MAG: hypothetical protein ACLUNV_08405 [Sutterella wadsworthensis]